MTMPSLKATPAPFRVLLLLGGFLVLIVVILAAGWFVYLQESNAYWIRHTLEVQKSISHTFSLLQDAETGQRGYLLTGGQDYLDPFTSADAEIGPELEKLTGLVTEPVQRQNIAALRSIVDDKRAELRRTIELRRSGDSEGALSVVREDTGKHLMDRARDLVARMQDAEETLLSERIGETRFTGSVLQGAIILAASLALLLALTSIYYLRRYLNDVHVAYERLATANNQLTHEMRERDRVEAQLRQSQKMEIIGQLTGGIAHDFNNMLAVVIGNLNLLQRRIANGQAEATRFINGAIEGANRAASLTHRLLAFSRQQPLTPAAVDANKLVSGMTELLGRTLGEAVVLETVLAGGLWRTHVDAAQLESALANLAVNARDAMREGGRLTIETGNTHLDEAYAASHEEVRAGQYVLVAITDTGAGMSLETIGKAFEPFFTTKPEGKGTGLGLSQVYGFVKQSGGHVKIYSEAGHGTTVKVYLPRLVGVLPETESPSAGVAAIHKGDSSEIVLVVEDDERVRRVTVEALRDLDYTVLHADGAAKALRVLDGHPDVRLLLTDIVMPEMNGRRLAEEALRRRSDLKVLYFTGFTRNAIVHNGMLDQGVHLMTKPFTLEQLAAKVREVLESPGGAPTQAPR
jgi:signal transduction histidine kinase/CheY-like chemotaxis protein